MISVIVMNTNLSYKLNYEQDIVIDDLSLSPNAYRKFLGVFINNKLSFNKHVDFLVNKCSSRVFLMSALTTIGLDKLGLLTLLTFLGLEQ